MNIFATSSCPYESAKALDNKRVIKMVLESAQMLSTVMTKHGLKGPYRPTHANHPCTIWAGKTRSNYTWLVRHFEYLFKEYTKRYKKTHKCESLYKLFKDSTPSIPQGPLTSFANCAKNKGLGYDFTYIKDTHLAYMMYLNERWDTDKRTPTWE